MAALACLVVLAPTAEQSAAAAGAPVAFVRVDQVGYPSDGPKVAYVMSTSAMNGATFSVRDAAGTTEYAGTLGASSGRWSAGYPYMYPVTFTGLTTAGTDDIVVGATPTVTSPTFEIAPASTLWDQALTNGVSFYQDQQDGPDYVPSPLRTAPAHLNDEHAMTYSTPKMNGNGDFSGDLDPLGTTMDASGGWWDAGDYLKFVETTSYVVALLGVCLLYTSRCV